MRRLLIVVVLFATACAGATTASTTTTTIAAPSTTTTAAPTTTTEPPGFTVTSDDGMVTLDVPTAAMAEDPGITIERLAPEDYPDDLVDVAVTPGSAVYALGPDGPVFDAPVTLTRRIPLDEFGDLPFGVVPMVTLITTTPDHDGWEYLADLSVIRDGDELVVSGTTTHFSRVAALGEQVDLNVRFVTASRDFATEVGVDFRFTAALAGFDGTALDPPPSVTLVSPPGGDGVTITPGDPLLAQCSVAGSIATTLAWQAVITRIEDGTDLLVSPRIVETDSVEAKIGITDTVRCLDPALAVTGRSVKATLRPDHPGGEQIVPGGDLMGGNSAILLTLLGLDDLPFSDSLLAGLIEDCDGDGTISDGDFILPPVETTLATPNGRTAVIPIFDLANYMVYVANGDAFTNTVIEEKSGVPILSGIPLLYSLFRGDGRFASSIGVVGDADGASIFPVTTSEDPTTLDRELIIFVTPHLVDPESAGEP